MAIESSAIRAFATTGIPSHSIVGVGAGTFVPAETGPVTFLQVATNAWNVDVPQTAIPTVLLRSRKRRCRRQPACRWAMIYATPLAFVLPGTCRAGRTHAGEQRATASRAW